MGELYRKGVTEQTTKLLVSDGSAGLESALDYHCYGILHQRCIFHKIKNLSDHLVFEELVIQGAQRDTTAERQARQARKKAILADASAVFFVDFDKTLAYLQVDLPDAPLPLVRTTNFSERFHREARRKHRNIGMFQSKRGCDMLWYLMAMRETAKQIALAECRL